MSLGERDQASGSQARHPRADTSAHDAVASSTPPATAERIHTRHSDREIRPDDIDDQQMSFSGSTQPSLRGHAHQSRSITIKSLTTASLTASDAAPHRVETLAGELAPESAQNSSSHRAGKGLSPSSRSTQSQTPRAGSSASSSTIAGLQDLRTGPSAPPPMLTGLPQHSIKERTYKLIIRQQPQQGRLCGLGSKDKRPLDPLPILQLRILRRDGTEDEDAENSPNLIVQVSLCKQDMATGTHAESVLVESNAAAHPFTRMLEGRLVASANVARDLDGSRACFFVFTDLSIRQEGHFRLAFKLIALGPGDPSSPGGQVLAEALTEPFAIYSPRRFPGMTESTELAKCLARQGIQVPVRNDVRRRQEQADSDERDND